MFPNINIITLNDSNIILLCYGNVFTLCYIAIA